MVYDLKRILGSKLRAERLARRLTQEQIAERIGRTVETVSNIERGKVYPSLDTLEQICSSMGMALSQVFDESVESQITAHRRELMVRLRVLSEGLTDKDLEIAVRQIEVLVQGRS